MILLDTDKLQIQTTQSGSVDFLACGASSEVSSPVSFTTWNVMGNISAATTTDIVAIPSSSTYKKIDQLFINNRSSSYNTVVIILNRSSTQYTIETFTLQPNEGVGYNISSGFNTYTSTGLKKYNSIILNNLTNILRTPIGHSANVTSALSLTSGTSYCTLVGTANKTIPAGSNLKVVFRTTTLGSTFTWGEVAIGTSPDFVANGANTITYKGFASITSAHNSTGNKYIVVTTSHPINFGEFIWITIGVNATTSGGIRAYSVQDELSTGCFQTIASRPSTILGVPTAHALAGAINIPWMYAVI